MQTAAMPIASSGHPTGTGGFLDPDKIVDEFGVEEGTSIADFGCGAGYFTILLAGKTGPQGKVYALDVMESALDILRAKARANNIENIETIRTNLEVAGSSALPDSSQDTVLLANILFQSNKKEDIIREGIRVLKQGGRIIIIDWKKGADGFGPPDNIRPDESEMKSLAKKQNLMFEKDLNAGKFHFGLIFRKS